MTKSLEEKLGELLANCTEANRHPDAFTESPTQQLNVPIRKLNEHTTIPTYAHRTDAGFDICASSDVIIEPGETAVIPTGLAMSVPEGYELQIRPRSGITTRTKLRVQLGTVDAGFSGEIGVIVDSIGCAKFKGAIPTNCVGLHGKPTEIYGKRVGGYVIRRGERIAQAVLAPIVQASFVEVEALDESERNGNGFGSTGVKGAKE